MVIVYVRDMFATKRLQSYSTNIKKMKFVPKKINQIFKKINMYSVSYVNTVHGLRD